MNEPELLVAAPSTTRRNRGVDAMRWWRRLIDPENGDRGSLAELRRARSPLEAMSIRAAIDLARRLGTTHGSAHADRTRDVLDLARVLAHVKEHDPSQRPMQSAGWKRFAGDRRESDAGDDRPKLAEARFRRLHDTGDGEEKVDAFVRLVALMGGTINVTALANDFLGWNHPLLGDRVRERWAFDYYHATSAVLTTAASDANSDPYSPTDDEDDE